MKQKDEKDLIVSVKAGAKANDGVLEEPFILLKEVAFSCHKVNQHIGGFHNRDESAGVDYFNFDLLPKHT